tara:strand:- start:603 stop:1358 length:756 start_codon:yes stop_codon:yes gene_type:complete
MMSFNKFFEKISRLFNFIISDDYKLNHKYQNKNQVTNAEIILNLLKNKNFKPKTIVDVGCGYGQWTKKIIKHYPNADYFLFDADTNNQHKLESLKKKYNNLQFKICLLSDDISKYTFYNMGYGSSIFEEQTNHKRLIQEIKSTTLIKELPSSVKNQSNNLIKLDVQGAELKILDGLKEYINIFEIVILEVSLHNYNKDAPLFDKIMTYMNNKNYKLYDIFDLKRLGEINSILIQFDCVFVKKDSDLFNVKF